MVNFATPGGGLAELLIDQTHPATPASRAPTAMGAAEIETPPRTAMVAVPSGSAAHEHHGGELVDGVTFGSAIADGQVVGGGRRIVGIGVRMRLANAPRRGAGAPAVPRSAGWGHRGCASARRAVARGGGRRPKSACHEPYAEAGGHAEGAHGDHDGRSVESRRIRRPRLTSPSFTSPAPLAAKSAPIAASTVCPAALS